MDYLSWFAVAVAVFSLGWAMFRGNVRGAEAGRWCTKSEASTLARRLTDCEQLLNELVQAISRMEARDKMRQVRAARKDGPKTPIEADQDEQPATPKVSTAELRRMIASKRV